MSITVSKGSGMNNHFEKYNTVSEKGTQGVEQFLSDYTRVVDDLTPKLLLLSQKHDSLMKSIMVGLSIILANLVVNIFLAVFGVPTVITFALLVLVGFPVIVYLVVKKYSYSKLDKEYNEIMEKYVAEFGNKDNALYDDYISQANLGIGAMYLLDGKRPSPFRYVKPQLDTLIKVLDSDVECYYNDKEYKFVLNGLKGLTILEGFFFKQGTGWYVFAYSLNDKGRLSGYKMLEIANDFMWK